MCFEFKSEILENQRNKFVKFFNVFDETLQNFLTKFDERSLLEKLNKS